MTTSPEETRVGPYRLLAHIGEGGMGVVHLAQGPDGRRVALKVLRPHVVGDAEARERLAQEVTSLQRISSPRIAEILDADPHGPLPYVVTRYVPGLSLYHHVAEEGLVEGRDLLHFADCLAEALAAVHAVGVLHRDVKPTNVLMEGRSPVLIDFGLARVADDPRLTQTGFLLGTPGYLAPEILYGDDATTAADVHAWAATVVYAATGRSPYGTGPTMAILDRVRRGQHDLSGVPAGLAVLLREALSPEHLHRPTVRELRAAVARLQAEVGGATGWPGRAEPGLDHPREPEPWTMPFAPMGGPGPADQPTNGLVASRATAAPVDDTVERPLAGEVVMRPATPYQQPAPPTTTQPTMQPTGQPTVITPVVPPGQRQAAYPPLPWAPEPPVPPEPRSSGTQRRLQLLGLGALSTAIVAYAPYLGTALVGLVVLAARTVSVTRQRHDRRRMLRGRPRWYDVPTTTVSTPAYALLALVGTVADVAVAALVGLALFSLGYLLQQGLAGCLVLAGLGFTPAVWWGPGSDRLRETTRRLVTRSARTELGGWFVAAMSMLGAAVVLGLLLGSGANWSPALTAPWR